MDIVDRKELNLPDAPAVVFEQNFIKTVVCELRFPTLLEYDTTSPVKLQKELRKTYPLYELQQVVKIRLEGVGPERKYVFQSRDKKWLVSFTSSAIALETTHYTEFPEFAERLKHLLSKSTPFIDSDFFTRVGLRYINEITIEDGEVSGWINEQLIAPLTQGVYGVAEQIRQEVRGYSGTGHYAFKHGGLNLNADSHQSYVLDFDFYQENVKVEEVPDLVSNFNKKVFQFFYWAIGPKARERLGKSSPGNMVQI